jgi:hypothetical protein
MARALIELVAQVARHLYDHVVTLIRYPYPMG